MISSDVKRMLCILAASLLGWNVVATPGVTKETIFFGQSACFSGPNQRLGINYRSGILVAFGERNAAGGVNGRQLELISLDDRYEPEYAAANAERFVTSDDVLAVIGGVGTPTAARIAPVLRNAGIPFIGHITGADFLHDAKRFPNVVNLRASYADEVQVLVKSIVKDRGLKRLGIIYQDDAFGRSVMRSYLLALAEYDIPLLAKTTYSRNTHAVHASLFGLAKADLEAILLVGPYSANAEITNLAYSLGYEYTFANLSFSLSDELRNRIDELSDRILLTEVVPSPNDPESELAGRFRRAIATYAAPDSIVLNEASLEGYLLGRYVASTLERINGDITRAAFTTHARPVEAVQIDDWTVAFKPGSNTGSSYIRLTHFDPDDVASRADGINP